MSDTRKATVCGKELRDDGDECYLHLSVDDDVVRVQVPYTVARDIRLYSEIDVPDGDLTRPEVSAGIVWRW